MIHRPALHALAPALCFALVVAGCLATGPRNEPIRYWMLSALSGPPGSTGRLRTLLVGPVEIPYVLQRPGIVLREGENRLFIAPLDRWAEPLDRGIARVVAEDIAALSGDTETIVFPSRSPIRPDLQLTLSIADLDARKGGDVALRATWRLSRLSDAAVVASGSTSLREPVGGDSIAEVVQATSRLLASWSRELVSAIPNQTRIEPTGER